MASKTKKGSVTPGGGGSHAGTPGPSSVTGSGGGRPSSPLSPTRHSRMQEKHDLQNLNDRLACYIDKVRYLETENTRLTREVQTSHETVNREVTSLKSMYDTELSDARKLLDETHKEKAKLEIDTKRLWDENEDLKSVLAKKNKDLLMAQNDVRVLETRANELQLKCNQAQSEKKKAAGEARDLEAERDKLKKFVDDLRKQLEEESLARVEVENSNQSLREELSFKDTVYQQQLTETRTRRQVEISEIDGRLSEQYEAKMQQALQDLREQYESQMSSNRAEIEALFESKIKNLQSAAQRNSGVAATAVDELRQTRTRIDSLNRRISELEGLNSSLQSRGRDLDRQLEIERQRHADDLALLEADLSRLRDEMAQQLQEYQDLMDIKVSLDIEISAYRKLLESEEARLKITPQSEQQQQQQQQRGSSVRRTPVRGGIGGKRKRAFVESSTEATGSEYSTTAESRGDIEVSEVCPDGSFVRLRNKGTKEVSLSGWQLVRKAGELETNFKFHRSVKVEPGAVVTVWSAESGQAHEPPSNIVMKGQKWFVGDNMSTVVLNANGEEIAHSERIKRQLSKLTARHRETISSSGYRGPGEEMYHAQGDPAGEEKCRIM